MVAMIVFFPFQSDYPNMDRKILITSQQRPNYDKQHHQFQLIIQMRYMSIYVWWSYQPYFCGVIPCSRLTNERKRSGSCQNNDDPLFPIGIGLQEGDRLPGTFSSPFQTRGLPLVVRNCMLSDYTQRQDQFLQINVRHQSSPLLKGFSLLDCCPLRLSQVFSLSERLFLNCLHFFFFSQAMTSSISLECSGLSPILPKLRPVFNINFMIVRAFRAAQKTRLGSLWAGKGVSLPSPSSTRQPLSLQFGSNGMTAFYSVSSPPPSDEGKPPQNSPVPPASKQVPSSPSLSDVKNLSSTPLPPEKQTTIQPLAKQQQPTAAQGQLQQSFPLGLQDFQAVQSSWMYFDKTSLIESVILNDFKAALFTLPRGFGKSIALSMINYGFYLLWMKIEPLRNLLQKRLQLERQLVFLNRKKDNIEDYLIVLDSKIAQSSNIDIINTFRDIQTKKREQLKTIEKQMATTEKQIKETRENMKISGETPKQFEKLFKDKSIYKNQKFKEGTLRCPIIKLQLITSPNIEKISPDNVEEFKNQVIHNFKKSVSRTFRQHSYLMSSLSAKIEMPSTGPISKEILEENLTKFCRIHDYQTDPELPFTDDEFKGSIVFLSKLLENHWSEYWGKETKPLILVDQYDLPFIDNMGKPFQLDIFQLLNDFYSSFIKGPGADHNFKVVMMGILPIKSSDIFSPANDLLNYNLCRNYNSFDFGFKAEEIKEKLRLVLQNRKESLTEDDFNTQFNYIKDWCNGYWISGQELYNPWSVINCLKEINSAPNFPVKQFRSLWMGSGHTSLFRTIIKNSSDKEEQSIAKFIQNGFKYVQGQYDTFDKWLPIDQMMKASSLFFILFHTGYLTQDRKEKNVYVVPNKEIASVLFTDILLALLEKRYPGISVAGNTQSLLRQSGEMLNNCANVNKFCQILQGLINLMTKCQKERLDSQQTDEQTIEQKIKLKEKHIGYCLIQRQCQRQFNQKDKQGYLIRLEGNAGGSKRMDRLMTSSSNDTVIIHQDKVASTEPEAETKMVEALNQIMERHLEHVLDKQLRPHVKNIQIAGIVAYQKEIQKQDKTKGKKSEKEAKVIGQGFTFTIEKARELLKEYREKFGGLEKGEICNQGNKEMREEFLEMLARYQKMVEKKIDQ